MATGTSLFVATELALSYCAMGQYGAVILQENGAYRAIPAYDPANLENDNVLLEIVNLEDVLGPMPRAWADMTTDERWAATHKAMAEAEGAERWLH
jgi:hypothetical protein